MRLAVGIAISAIALVLAVWTSAASYLFLLLTGMQQAFPGIWSRSTVWWVYVLSPLAVNNWVRIYLGLSGLGAALPLVLLGIPVGRSLWRSRRRLTKPWGGGVRPIVRGVTDNHGNATILSDQECLQRFSGPTGMVIGELRTGPVGTTPLVIDPIKVGAGHGMLVAGTRAGKSQSAATTLMHWPGSAVVLDPSGELANMLTPALMEDGKRVIVLDPERPETGFNCCDWIDPTRSLAGLDVRTMVSWIFPDTGQNEKVTKDGYFEPSGRSLCITILADLLWSDIDPVQKNLREFRRRIATPEHDMPKLLTTIHARSNSPLARDLAGTLMRVATKQFSGIYGQAVQSSDWIAEPGFAALVSGGDFKSNVILDGETVIFVKTPLAALMQSPGVGRVIIGSLLMASYKSEITANRRRTLYCLDEAWVLGPMAVQEQALVTGAKFAVTLFFLYQSLGQVKKIWGEAGMQTLLGNLEWRGFAAIKDDETAETVSKSFGEISVMAYSEGDNTGTQRPAGIGWGSRSSGQNVNVHEIKRRLILPQELTSAPPDDLFVISAWGKMRLRMPMAYRRVDLQDQVRQSHFV